MKKRWAIYLLISFAIISCAPPQQDQLEKEIVVFENEAVELAPAECTDLTFHFDWDKLSPHQVIIDATPPHTFSWSLG